MKVVLTYGTFDTFHYGHLDHLKKSKKLGDYLIVGVSTDEFNSIKGKYSLYEYDQRREMIEALKIVDLVIPESSWEQKIEDIKKYNVSVIAMGDDWAGDERFESLKEYCEVVYTRGGNSANRISSSKIREGLKIVTANDSTN